MSGPLDGIQILDLTIYQNGPWGTVMLSDMGADVIKIEDPVNGDPGRNLTPAGEGRRQIRTYFQTMNRNKRSMTLNLKSQAGREVFYELARQADAITQNFRVGVVERLGVDYETIRKINPKIVYASVSGFGSKGPDAKDGVYDILGQARGGFMSLLSASDPHVNYKANGGLADQMGAITLAYGLVLGLMARERKGIGQHVEVSQLGGQMILQALAINGYLIHGDLPRARTRGRAGNPLFNIYRCADDRWVALGCIQSDRYWPAFCQVLGIAHLQDDPRFADHDTRSGHAKELTEVLDQHFAEKTRDEWIALLKPEGVLCTPVQNYDDLPKDPQVIANEYLVDLEHPTEGTIKQVGVPVKLSETPGAAHSTAPEFGEHTEEILLAQGYDWDRIAGLREQGVI